MLNFTNIVLISVNRFKVPYPVYPIGVSYLAVYLRENMDNCNVTIMDFNLTEYAECISRLKEIKPDYIGISMRNIDDVNLYNRESFIDIYKQLIEDVRENLASKIIVGGAGYSLYPELLFGMLKPDFAVVGEGEECLCRLISAVNNNQDYTDIDGLVYADSDQVVVNRKIISTEHNMLNLFYEDHLVDYYWKHGGMINLQTKRGCPYNCIYCTYPLIEGREVRTNSIDKVMESVYNLYHKHGVDYIFFTDSVFNIKNSYNYEFADALIKSGIKIRWGGYFSPGNLDEDLLSLLKRSGLYHIEFGTESLSDKTLKSYQKHFTVSDIMNVSATCNKLELNFAHFMILGGYGETEETLEETFENCKRIDNTIFFPFIGMRIYPDTYLHRIAVEENLVGESDNLINPVFYVSKEINTETIKERAKKSGKKWFFPDEDFSEQLHKMRMRNKKGLLWENLIRY